MAVLQGLWVTVQDDDAERLEGVVQLQGTLSSKMQMWSCCQQAYTLLAYSSFECCWAVQAFGIVLLDSRERWRGPCFDGRTTVGTASSRDWGTLHFPPQDCIEHAIDT